MSTLIMWHNRFSENKNETVETHIPRHRDSKTKKPRHRDSKTKKPRPRDSGTKTPRHRETETTVVRSAVFTGHLVYACVVVALISRNDNSLIMRRELTCIY